jgi:AcrR family transcriptional regulator
MCVSSSVADRLSYVYSDNMADRDNSVNIARANRAYHHGDLRQTLIDAGMELLRSRAVSDLSLREVARAVGVSPTAVYRHFPDKAALLYALCEEGAQALARMQAEAMAGASDAGTGFDATGRAYVRFALRNPALYRLMMSTRPPIGHFSGDVSAVNAAMGVLRENVSRLMPPGTSPERQRRAAIHAWSLVHGMAMLMLDGQIPADDSTIDSISRTAILQ